MATVTSSKRQLLVTSDTYTSNGDVTVGGDLTINGTTTTLDTTNLLVEDKNIIIGNVSSPSDTTADGGGITLKGASDYTINWSNANNRWDFNQGIHSSSSITASNISGSTSGTNTGDQDLSGYALTSHNHNIWDLTATRSSINIDTVGNNNFWDYVHETSTSDGTHVGSYQYVVSFGDESQGIQFSHSYGSPHNGLYFRAGSDNNSSENGANTYKNWRRVLTTSDEGSGNGLDADTLDGQEGSYYLDYANFTSTPTIPTDFVSKANGGDFSGKLGIKIGQVWDATTQGKVTGSLHIDPELSTDHAGGAITFGASDSSNGENAQAGIYIRSDGTYGTRMYFSTTDSYATGSKTAMYINHNKDVYFLDNIDVAGDITVSGTVDGVDISALPTTFAPTNAEANVQADWNETTNTSDAFILNKPTIPAAVTDFVSKANGGTFSGNVKITDALNSGSPILDLHNSTNAEGTGIRFTDVAAGVSQFGNITYRHADAQSYGSGASFTIGSDQTTTTILADGKLMYNEGIYSKPSSGTGAGTRKDSNWDTAYGWGDHASGGYASNTNVSNWDTAYTHSQAAHAPSNAEANVQADWTETTTTSDAFILNKPTIPSGNSIIDWTADQGSTNIHVNNVVGYINSTEPNEPFNPFAGQKFHDGVLTNALAGRHDRFEVTIDGTTEAGASLKLSNQNFEEYNQNRLFGTSAGETKVFNINVQSLATGSPSSSGITYSAGFFDINFYSSPFPASWSARVKNKDGNWTTVTSLTKIGSSKLRGVIPIGNWLTDIEFTLTARTSAPFVTGNITYGISEFELFFSRMTASQGGNISSIGGYLGGTITTASGTTSTNWNTAYAHSQAAHAPSNAEANVQADWNETTTTSDAFILNKPTIPAAVTDYVSKANGGTFSGDVTIIGNLTVDGTTTTLSTTTVEVEDNILQLNTTEGSPDTATAATSGISIYRGDGVTQASLIFDDADDTWDLTNNLNVANNITAAGFVQATGYLYVRDNIRLLNKAANNWLTFAYRNTTASEAVYDLAHVGTITTSGNINTSGGLVVEGSVDSGGTDMGYYQSAGTNIILKGDLYGRSGIFFESEKDGTNINDPSDYGFIQFHSYGYGNTPGETNNLVIGVSNDSDDKLILQAPYNGGVMIGYKDATSGTGLTLSEVIHNNASSYNNGNWDTAYGWGDHASQSYITNSTASLDANKITSGVLNAARVLSPVNGDWWNGGCVKVGTDGVMEVGKYLDFHTADSGGNTDYDLRVTASANALSVGGTISATNFSGSSSGTNTGDQDLSGYATTSSIPTASSLGAVTLTGTQSISGAKTFSNTNNYFSGHLYYTSFDSNGNHYPHFKAGSNANGTTINFRQYYNASSYITHVWKATSASNAYFDFVGQMRPNGLLSDGNVDVIGDINVGSASNTSSYKLNLHGSTANKVSTIKCTDGNLHIDSEDSSALYLNYYEGASTNIYFGTGNGGYCGTVSSAGLLRMANDVVAYYSFSDRRLKTDIKTTENNLEKILSLNPVEYTWKEGPREGVKEIGLIAQEVEEVVPEVVRVQSRHHDEKSEGEEYKQVDYEHLVSTLIGAMQEQQQQIDELKSQMAACKERACNCKN